MIVANMHVYMIVSARSFPVPQSIQSILTGDLSRTLPQQLQQLQQLTDSLVKRVVGGRGGGGHALVGGGRSGSQREQPMQRREIERQISPFLSFVNQNS